jgi:small subunit ribosomal protein S21
MLANGAVLVYLTCFQICTWEVILLPGVVIGDNDTFDYSLRKFKKQVEKAGILSELKKRQHYEKPSIQKKKKEAAARKRLMKKMRKIQMM